MNTDKADFKNMRQDFKERSHKEQIKSLCKRLFMGKFNLSQTDLEEGLRAGEAHNTEENQMQDNFF